MMQNQLPQQIRVEKPATGFNQKLNAYVNSKGFILCFKGQEQQYQQHMGVATFNPQTNTYIDVAGNSFNKHGTYIGHVPSLNQFTDQNVKQQMVAYGNQLKQQELAQQTGLGNLNMAGGQSTTGMSMVNNGIVSAQMVPAGQTHHYQQNQMMQQQQQQQHYPQQQTLGIWAGMTEDLNTNSGTDIINSNIMAKGNPNIANINGTAIDLSVHLASSFDDDDEFEAVVSNVATNKNLNDNLSQLGGLFSEDDLPGIPSAKPTSSAPQSSNEIANLKAKIAQLERQQNPKSIPAINGSLEAETSTNSAMFMIEEESTVARLTNVKIKKGKGLRGYSCDIKLEAIKASVNGICSVIPVQSSTLIVVPKNPRDLILGHRSGKNQGLGKELNLIVKSIVDVMESKIKGTIPEETDMHLYLGRLYNDKSPTAQYLYKEIIDELFKIEIEELEKVKGLSVCRVTVKEVRIVLGEEFESFGKHVPYDGKYHHMLESDLDACMKNVAQLHKLDKYNMPLTIHVNGSDIDVIYVKDVGACFKRL